MIDALGVENGSQARITLDDSRLANDLATDNTGRRNELDYVLVRANGSVLTTERTRHVFRRSGWDNSPADRLDLSYRYAVGARVTFSSQRQFTAAPISGAARR